MAIYKGKSTNEIELLAGTKIDDNKESQAYLDLYLTSDVNLNSPTRFNYPIWTIRHKKGGIDFDNMWTAIIQEDGLYNITGGFSIKGHTATTRNFFDFTITNGGTYATTEIRSSDTQELGVGDPTYCLNGMVYIKAGATIEFKNFSLHDTTILQGGVDRFGTYIRIVKIGRYLDA